MDLVGNKNIKSIVFPKTLREIGSYAFKDCPNLKKLTFHSNFILVDSSFVDSYAICEVFVDDFADYVASPHQDTDSMQNKIEEINNLPGKIGPMYYWLFNCSSLRTVKYSECILYNHDLYFNGCTQLESVDLPSTITNLYYISFDCCDSLKRLICRAVIPPNFGASDNPIMFSHPFLHIFVPAESVETYRSDPLWGQLPHIYSIDEMEDNPDDIEIVPFLCQPKVSRNLYNLQGQKVQDKDAVTRGLKRGIYISGGRKFVVR